MNTSQIVTQIRSILLLLAGSTIGAALLAKIGLQPADVSTVVESLGAIAGIVGVVWAHVSHSDASNVARAAKTVSVPAASQAAVGITSPITPQPST